MNVPQNLRYTKDHEWARKDDDDLIVVGITDFAQSELGDIVFVELPEVGTMFDANAVFGTVEAVKAVSELFLPIAGKIVSINNSLNDTPESINNAPYDEGWMVKIAPDDPADWDSLLSADEYEALIS